MTTLPLPDAATAKSLRHLVASVIADQKSYNVPSVCQRYGLDDGTVEEAHSSKYKYVSARVQSLTAAEILEVARALHGDEPRFDLGEVLAKFDESRGPHVTELTRRRVVSALEDAALSIDTPEMEFLKRLWPLDQMSAPKGSFSERTMEDYIIRHRIANFDMTTKDVLESLEIYSCSQMLFFRFIEALTHPMLRDERSQRELVGKISPLLAADGFDLIQTDRISGSPIFSVRRSTHGGKTPADEEIGRSLSAFNVTDVHERWQEAMKRRASDPRAAITVARTLLEDVCKWLLAEAGETVPDDEDLPGLYKRVAAKLRLAPDQHTEKIFKQILGSCQSIVESLGAVRNKLGDAHSQGPAKARPQARHAELAVNLAGSMATFLVATWEARKAEAASDT